MPPAKFLKSLRTSINWADKKGRTPEQALSPSGIQDKSGREGLLH